MRLIIAILLPWLLFFTIGRPLAGIVCLILQITHRLAARRDLGGLCAQPMGHGPQDRGIVSAMTCV